MRRFLLNLIMIFGGIFLSSSSSNAAYFSFNFDDGKQGWQYWENYAWSDSLGWQQDSGGNGYVSLANDYNIDYGYFWYYNSPTVDWSNYIGGTFSYDLNLTRDPGSLPQSAWDSLMASNTYVALGVNIAGDGGYMYWLTENPFFEGWRTYSFQLIENNFIIVDISGTSPTFDSIMSSISSIMINGEFRLGDETTENIYHYNDMAYLDNVNIDAVPIPATMLLLGSGLIGLAGYRRKFRQN